MEIRDLDLIRIGDADEADARRRQIKPDRRTQPAGAQNQHLGLPQPKLT